MKTGLDGNLGKKLLSWQCQENKGCTVLKMTGELNA